MYLYPTEGARQRGLKTKRPTLVIFLGPTKRNLSHHMQAHTGDTVLVKSREMTGMNQTKCRGNWGRRGKDDRKQNALAPLGRVSTYKFYT
jgi:hypothetical protein